MEASALTYQAGIGLHGRSPLLRLQSDERLITLLRRGNTGAFEVLFSRYETRLLSFCRHLLGSREDAEDVLQEVMTAAFNAIVADERPINVRPWLYRIARNRSLNHLRKTQAIGVDSMDHHLAENGATTADKVHEREQFRLLVGDIQGLPESQRTALVLREMDALSYEQIAEAMETTVSSVKSLLVRARMGLAEASEARLLSCEEVRMELAEIAEGLQKKPSPLVRRHLKGCKRCSTFRTQLKATNKALAALLPVGPLIVFKKLAFLHLGHSAGASAGAGTSATAAAAGSTASAGAGAAIGSGVFGGGSVVSAGMSAVATKAAAGLAAAVIVTAGAVEVDHSGAHHPAAPVASVPQSPPASPIAPVHSFGEKPSTAVVSHPHRVTHRTVVEHKALPAQHTTTVSAPTTSTASTAAATTSTTSTTEATTSTPAPTAAASTPTTTTAPGRVQTQTDPTVLPPPASTPAPPISAPTTPATPVTTTGTATSGTGTTGTGTATTGTGTTATGTTGTGTTGTGTTGTETTGTGTTGTATVPPGSTGTGTPTVP